MTPPGSPEDAGARGARHSTFRPRASFALPVVLVVAFGAGCGSDHATVVTKTSTTVASTTTASFPGSVITEPPPSTNPGPVISNPLPPGAKPAAPAG
ncbi:MAG: hypothetical protein LC792_06040 [Actinobacteria bacterium]|nr:hypothetical protein [Actinomycetota bacterium]